jgi:hypothetical protein
MWDFSDAEEVEIEEEKKPDEPEEKPSPEGSFGPCFVLFF